MNLNTCKFVVWGAKNRYDTFGHIHEAWLRALRFRYPDRSVQWLDVEDDISNVDFSDTFFITMNTVVAGMPLRQDGFYFVHNTDENVKSYFGDISNYGYMNYGVYTATQNMGDDIRVGPAAYLSMQRHEKYPSMVMPWATDLFPHEIMANKPICVFNLESREINFVGTHYPRVHEPFARACKENGINWKIMGGTTGTRVSIEDNARLVRASYMAPAINDPYHSKVGYLPCRVFKNISYGCMPLTNNIHVQAFFGYRLIHSEDTHRLFYEGKEQLPQIKVDVLHKLMDEVAREHTYLARLDSVLAAVRLVQETR